MREKECLMEKENDKRRERERQGEKEKEREKERRQHKERPVEIFQFIFTQAMPLTQIVFSVRDEAIHENEQKNVSSTSFDQLLIDRMSHGIQLISRIY